MNDAEILRDRYTYNPETGEFLWRNPPIHSRKSAVRVGEPAGAVDKRDGSRQLTLEGRIHQASRLAWLYVHGEWPARQVQYEDPTLPLPTRDRIANLRLSGEKTEITQEALKRVLDYNPDLGEFRWKVSRKGIRQGAIAGGPKKTSDGLIYHYIRVDGIDYPGHRLAWLYVHGRWPTARLSFKNNRPADLRIDNLVEGEFVHGTRQDAPITQDDRARRRFEAQQRHDLMRHHGMGRKEKLARLDAQNHRCMICDNPETEPGNHGKIKELAVDHDHKTGANRDLICSACNKVMGHFKDSIPVLMAFVAYLAKHGNPEGARVLRQIHLGRQAAVADGAVMAGLLSEAA